jgi:hypothetical protein
MLTFLKRTKFPNHVVCAWVLTWVSILKIQTIYMCEKLLTCWLCLKRLNFRTMRCVKGCWQADFAWTDQISEPYGVWKATDLLTLLKQTKFQNHMVCEKLLISWLCVNRVKFQTMWCVKSDWHADFALKDKISKPCGVWNASDLLTLIKERKFPNHVVCAYGFLQYLSSEYKLYICVKSCWHADFVSTD